MSTMATGSLPRMMADDGTPVMGDLLRLAFHASRFHPDARLRASVGEAIDLMLDAQGACAYPAQSAAEALAAAEGTALAPMVFAEADALLASRFLRLAELADPANSGQGTGARVFVGSADAVGSGQGAVLGREGAAAYHTRADRTAEASGLHWVNLGIARMPRDLALPRGGDEGTLEVEREGGVAIACHLASLPGDSPAFDKAVLGFHHPGRPIKYQDRGGRQLVAELDQKQCLRVRPGSPEESIRFASDCGERPRLLLVSSVKATGPKAQGTRCRGSFDVLVQLAPLADAPCGLPCVRISHAGSLADWMSLPATMAALDLPRDQRAEIAAHYATT